MKKIFFASVMATVVSISSCNNNFDPVITGVLSPANFPKTEADFELYALQAYKPFGSKWGYSDVEYQNMFFSPEYGHLAMFDLPTDQMNIFTEWGGFWEFFSKGDFTFLKTQGKQSHFEKVRYVTRMTQVIADVEKSTISETAKKKFIAEARMGRAWTMYYLLHMYGPVPVILDASKINTDAESDLTRPSRESFVSTVVSDLRFAADNLPLSPSEYGRFNKGLALGMLTRLYLNEKNWAEAEKAARETITLGKYNLVSDYAGLFRESTEVNSETIWAVNCDPVAPTNGEGGGNFNAMALYCLPGDFKSVKLGGGWGSPSGVFCPTWQFYDSFEATDKRRALLIPTYTDNGGKVRSRANMRGPVLRKYPDESSPGADIQGNDIPVLRYADIVLMLAEAINQQAGPTAEAVALVNEVRLKHGGLAALPAAATASKADFNDAILRERGWEFYFEGIRKIDLVRHGKWASALEAAGKVTHGPSELFPVPQYVINVGEGKIKQTQGY
ncbi:RagB/SusD family nutrient uptake outer membrane protein [Dyadobacter diqingensis]|uniref:RagB/SusD family nutrient uptake outer membrane protein n=1 Tax=Dyadobacter diqingensis TaxID=2938121 RepID=UPI0020C45F3F|nr:RagB/SusD family nutrient uptake outer membrane protein [Dyadobacter diqingensis]